MRKSNERSGRQTLREAAQQAEALQREAASLLYSRLISPGGPATVASIAEALGVGQSTVYRQCGGEIPVQLRTLAALACTDLDGLKALLDLLGRVLGLQWTWNLATPEPPDGDAAFRAVAEVSLACSEAALQEYGALRDGAISAGELAELEQRWRAEDLTKERMRALIRALAGDRVRQAPPGAG